MEYRLIGKTGLRVSSLSLGTMTFGKEADEKTSIEMVDYCLDQGLNLFDTANLYTEGASETILGKAIRQKRNQCILATKAFFPVGPGPNQRGLSRYHIFQSVETSLKRLQTDRIELFYLHCFDPNTALEETLRAVETLVQQGKILYPAVSNFSAWQAMDALSIAELNQLNPIVAIQPMYNLLKRQAEVELFPFAKAKNIAVLPYNPLAAGMLTGKYLKKSSEGSSRLNVSKPYQVRYGASNYETIVEKFIQFCEEQGINPVSHAIAWVKNHPQVSSVLLGARNMQQLTQCLEASSITLDKHLWGEIAGLSDAPPIATDRREEQMGLSIAQK